MLPASLGDSALPGKAVCRAPALRDAGCMTPRRFVPQAAVARRFNLVVAGLTGLAILVLLWFEGVRDMAALGLAGLVVALLTLGASALLHRAAGAAVVEIAADALTIEHRRGRVRLPWAEITHVGFGSLIGDHMMIGRRGAGPLRVRLEGHDAEALAEIRRLVAARTGESG